VFPDDPEASLWQKADSLEVPNGAPGGSKTAHLRNRGGNRHSRALYDDNRLAFLLEWDDAGQDVSIGGVGSFRDAVAIQFPSEATKAFRISEWGS
jgi:DMSO reductase family type II enzyme heme b subunit